jgi:hypothetical protein
MRLWLALVLGAVAACAPAVPDARVATSSAAVRAASYGVFVKLGPSAEEGDAERSRPAPPAEIGLPLFSTEVRPTPPRGVACTVYGRGSGLYRRCGGTTVNVNATPSSSVTTAVLSLQEAEFAWGFYPDRQKAWIFVDDGTFIVDGFTDPANARFALRREVGVVADHVWFKGGVAVRAMKADPRGVSVAIDDEVAGIEDIAARVPCDALLFDRDLAPVGPVAGAVAMPSVPPDRVVYAAPEKLALHVAPNGEPAFALGSKERRFDIPLQVLEERGKWVRVAFETDSARFDLWARDSDVTDALALGSISTSSCCGGASSIGVSARASIVVETTRLIVGATPSGAPTSSVAIRKGAEVDVESVQDGFAAIRPRGYVVVTPPDGASFWVPQSMLY